MIVKCIKLVSLLGSGFVYIFYQGQNLATFKGENVFKEFQRFAFLPCQRIYAINGAKTMQKRAKNDKNKTRLQ